MLKKKIAEWNIDISHFDRTRNARNKSKLLCHEKYLIEDILIQDSPITQKVLRGYIERHKLLRYTCQICGCDGNWQGGHIALELDHINGDNKDNRLENLRYLCPNCHAMTVTYRGRNKKLKNLLNKK